MTRTFNTEFHCSACGCYTTAETLFGRWIRENKELDSKKGYCVYDVDYIVHKFKTHQGRDFQMMMFVEIKTMGADVTKAQHDSLLIVDSCLKNRRSNKHEKTKNQNGTSPQQVYSMIAGKKVNFRHFGFFLLRFSGLGPQDSEWIEWNRKRITTEQLTSLLKFDLDPRSLKPITEVMRKHHKQKDFLLPFEEEDKC